MKIKIEHEHKCELLAEAIGLPEGRKLRIGKLLEKVPEYPEEEFCVHIKTPVKEVQFFCTEMDLRLFKKLCENALNEH